MKSSPHAEAYLDFLKLSVAIKELPGFEDFDANHKALFEAVVLNWFLGNPLSVRETINLAALGSPATLHKRLQRLIAQDLVVSEGSATDRRTKFVSPTKKGLDYAHWQGQKLQQAQRSSKKKSLPAAAAA